MTPKEQFLNSLQNGGTVELTDDIALDAPVSITNNTVIDLNDHEITSTVNDTLFKVNGANLTLTGDGNIHTSRRIADVTNGGTLTIEDGTYETNYEGFKAIGEGSTIIFNDGTLRTVECGLGANRGATIKFNRGTIITSDNMGIGTNGSPGEGGNTIIMNGGEINASITTSGYEAVGVYIANNDTFVMNDGEIAANGGTGICMRGGDVTIHGGLIRASGVSIDGVPVADGWIGDKETVITGVSAIVYDEASNYPGKAGMKLTVDGGMIIGADKSIDVRSNEATPQVFVTGGTLTPAYAA